MVRKPELDTAFRPIVACFTKWSDKEEVMRKKQLLKMKGIIVEEDLSRAARTRRRELEKLFKNIKAKEPDRRCFLTYDKLVVDDNVYIFNDLEGRVERLPHKVVLSQSTMDLSSMRDTYSSTSQSFRGSNQNIRKGLSNESLLDRIPAADVSEPRVSSGARKSLENLSRSTSNITTEADTRPSSRSNQVPMIRSRTFQGRPLSRASSVEGK